MKKKYIKYEGQEFMVSGPYRVVRSWGSSYIVGHDKIVPTRNHEDAEELLKHIGDGKVVATKFVEQLIEEFRSVNFKAFSHYDLKVFLKEVVDKIYPEEKLEPDPEPRYKIIHGRAYIIGDDLEYLQADMDYCFEKDYTHMYRDLSCNSIYAEKNFNIVMANLFVATCLQVKGDFSCSKDLKINGGCYVDGKFNVSENAEIKGELKVGKDLFMGGRLLVNGDLNVGGECLVRSATGSMIHGTAYCAKGVYGGLYSKGNVEIIFSGAHRYRPKKDS